MGIFQVVYDNIANIARDASIPVAVTCGRNQPGILDFSRPPGVDDVPCRGGVLADPSPGSDLSATARQSLLVMARLTAAYTNEVASN